MRPLPFPHARLAAAVLAVALPVLLPAVLHAETVRERYERLIKDLDPGQSESVLRDTRFLEELRKLDAEAADRLVKQKGVLQDLAELFRQSLSLKETDEQVRFLRRALKGEAPHEAEVRDAVLARHGLGPQPDKLVQWAARYRLGASAGLGKALLAWSELDADQNAWLGGRGLNAGSWEAQGFSERSRRLGDWAGERAEAILRRLESGVGAEERGVLEKTYADRIMPFMTMEAGHATGRKVWDHLLAGKYAEQAAKDPAVLADARLQALLAAASDASRSPEARLDALAQLFDKRTPSGAEPGTAAILRSRLALPAGKRLTKDDARTLGDMLPDAWLKEIKGTVVGDELVGFYGDRKPKVGVSIDPDDRPIGHFATYTPRSKRITLSGRSVEEWLKTHRREPRELLSQDEVFREFVRDTAPAFVHEAVHDQQHAEMDDRDIDDYNRELEIHADFMAAAFTSEQLSRMSAEQHRKRRDSASGIEELHDSLSAEFERGPRSLQQASMVFRYGNRPGAAFSAALETARAAGYRDALLAERERRRWLSEAALQRIAENGIGPTDFKDDWGAPEDFERRVRNFRNPLVDELLRESAKFGPPTSPYADVRAYLDELEKRQAGTWKKVRARTGGNR